jgi:hypothetical protein
MRDKVSHPYKTTGKIIVLYILIFTFKLTPYIKYTSSVLWAWTWVEGLSTPAMKVGWPVVHKFASWLHCPQNSQYICYALMYRMILFLEASDIQQ